MKKLLLVGLLAMGLFGCGKGEGTDVVVEPVKVDTAVVKGGYEPLIGALNVDVMAGWGMPNVIRKTFWDKPEGYMTYVYLDRRVSVEFMWDRVVRVVYL